VAGTPSDRHHDTIQRVLLDLALRGDGLVDALDTLVEGLGERVGR
jgi:hypothetical protein